MLLLVATSLIWPIQGLNSIQCNFLRCNPKSVTYNQIGNGSCDLGCMNQICNFDSSDPLGGQKSSSDCLNECLKSDNCKLAMLGDGKCDSACNTNACGWDWGDCGYCAQGCYKEQIESSLVCYKECENVNCSLQGGVCGGYCSKNCYRENLENQICEQACANESCNMDNFNPECKKCQPWMLGNRICDSACNTVELNYDNWDCACAQGCTPEMLNNTVCDWPCYTKRCNYDNQARCTAICNTGCYRPMAQLTCTAECLTWFCDYNDYGQCPAKWRQHAFYTQIITQNLKYTVFIEDTCLKPGSACTLDKLGDGTCHKECNTKECTYDFGDCNSSCALGCTKCYENNNVNKCLECRSDYFLLYTKCTDECVRGFVAKTKLNQKVCELVNPIFGDEVPTFLYVSQDRSKAPSTQRGTLAAPYGSLSTTLSHVRNKRTIIYLMKFNQDNHILDSLDKKNFSGSRLSKDGRPLDFEGMINPEIITIQPFVCPTETTKFCYSNREKAGIRWGGAEAIQLDVFSMLNITDVELIGFNFISETDCLGQELRVYCTYCQYVYNDEGSGKLYDDKDQMITWNYAKSSSCELYSSISLFIIHKGTLILNRVKISNWRAGFFSIIHNLSGSIFLYDVDFLNIQTSNLPYSAVISSNDCNTNSYECGSLYYERGSIRLINNGFEYNDRMYFSGLLYGKGMKNVSFLNITIENNLAYKGRSVEILTYPNIGNFIFIENFLNFTFWNNNVSFNYLDTFITLRMLAAYNRTLDNSSNLIEYNMLHVNISNNTFSSSYGVMINFEFYSQLPNMLLKDNLFTYIISTSNLIDIQLDAYSSKYYTGGSLSFTQDNSLKLASYNPSYFHIYNLEISHCYTQENLLYLSNLVNLQIFNLSIHSSLEFSSPAILSEYISDMVYKHFIESDSYITDSFYSEYYNNYLRHEEHLVILKNVEGINMQNVTIWNNTSSQGGTDFMIDSPGQDLKILNISIDHNFANRDSAGSGLSILKLSTSIDLSGLNFSNNSNTIGYGAVYITAYQIMLQENMQILIKNSIFTSNYAAYGGAVSINSGHLMIENTEFDSNSVTGFYGGAVYYSPLASTNSSYFTIRNSLFSSNKVISGEGGAIAIHDPTISENVLIHLVLEQNKFLNNNSMLDSSILFISRSVRLTNDSLISTSEFHNNTSIRNSNMFIGYLQGVLSFNNCSFVNNKSNQGIILQISISDNTKNNPTKVIISNSTFYRNQLLKEDHGSLIRISDRNYFSYLESYYNIFEYNTASILYISRAEWRDLGSSFSNNTAYQSPILQVINQGKAFLLNSSILNNYSILSGGVGLLGSQSTVSISQGNIQRNRSDLDGAVIYMEHSSILHIDKTVISSNYASRKGSILYAIGCESPGSYISDSDLFNNTSGAGGSIFLTSSVLNITQSVIYSNIDKRITPGIILAYSSLYLDKSSFKDQTGSMGLAVYTTSESKVIIESCLFDNLIAEGLGGAIVTYNGEMIINSSIFRNLHSKSAGAILAYTNSTVDISHSHFYNISSIHNGSIIKSFEARIKLSSSRFSHFEPTAIEGSKLKRLEMVNSSFIDGLGDTGAAILCDTCEVLNIYNSLFANLTGSLGGAIYAMTESEIVSQKSLAVYNSTFTHNIAYHGGAIYISNLNLEVINSTFNGNSAILDPNYDKGIGGGIAIECPDLLKCQFNISQNTFLYNSADRNGGCISWKHFEPNLKDNRFYNNTAIYGNEIASFASRLAIISDETLDIQVLYERGPVSAKYKDIAPGQNNINIRLALVDLMNQIVTSDSSSLAEIVSEDENVVLSGETKKKAKNGIIVFNDFIISGIPGSDIKLPIYTSDGIISTNLRSSIFELLDRIFIQVSLRECKIGEKESDNKCIACPVETYSLEPKEGLCKACPPEAVCYGGYSMAPKKGYWRSNEFSENFITCPNQKACLGSYNLANLTLIGECREGYIGNLCDRCVKGYSKSADHTCHKCSGGNMDVFKIISFIFLVGGLFVLLVNLNLKSAYRPKSVQAIYMKIFFNYTQLAMLTANLDLDWPDITVKFLSAQDQAGSLSEHFFSLDCIINDYYSYISYEDIYYIELIVMFLLPSVLICISFLVWMLISMYENNMKYMKEEFVSTIVIILIFIHPNLVKYLFSTLSCKELEPGEYWVRGNYDIRCWNDNHTSHILWIVVPGILIWGIIAPAICLAVLIHNRRRLNNIQVRLRLGFLFNGYNNKYYYWEFLIMYRKVLIIFCSTFLSSISISLQALTVSILLTVSLYMHLNQNPFRYKVMNEMEKRSNLVAIVTIYCGLYYMTTDLNNEINILFLLLILCINAYFMYFWIVNMIKASHPLLRKIPILRKFVPREMKDDYSQDLFVSPIRSRRTAVDEDRILTIASRHQEPQENFSAEYLARFNGLKKLENAKSLYMLIVHSKVGYDDPITLYSQNLETYPALDDQQILTEESHPISTDV